VKHEAAEHAGRIRPDEHDTLRFYALRMHEAGMTRSNPQTLIAEHTDWRFLNELKCQMKT
jgi:NitT/TauT family transport system substrate-binding protein